MTHSTLERTVKLEVAWSWRAASARECLPSCAGHFRGYLYGDFAFCRLEGLKQASTPGAATLGTEGRKIAKI